MTLREKIDALTPASSITEVRLILHEILDWLEEHYHWIEEDGRGGRTTRFDR